LTLKRERVNMVDSSNEINFETIPVKQGVQSAKIFAINDSSLYGQFTSGYEALKRLRKFSSYITLRGVVSLSGFLSLFLCFSLFLICLFLVLDNLVCLIFFLILFISWSFLWSSFFCLCLIFILVFFSFVSSSCYLSFFVFAF